MTKQRYHRCSIRLKDYDYSQPGAYFVTNCTQDRKCLFGEIADGEMRFNKAGEIVRESWNDLPNHYPNLTLDAYVIMPNHFHGIIMLTDTTGLGPNVGAGFKPAPTKRYRLSEIVRAFKTFSARRINLIQGTPGVRVWQQNYYEHVIRNEEDLLTIQKYIQENPLKWDMDPENPSNRKS